MNCISRLLCPLFSDGIGQWEEPARDLREEYKIELFIFLTSIPQSLLELAVSFDQSHWPLNPLLLGSGNCSLSSSKEI